MRTSKSLSISHNEIHIYAIEHYITSLTIIFQTVQTSRLPIWTIIVTMAKYHVCDRCKEQSEAFARGLWDVIDKQWLGIVNEPEMRVLFSGPCDGMIDILDMKANTNYADGYHSLDRHVSRFWKGVSSLNKKQHAALLRFVTSCERPPPLGFASIKPPFTIQWVSSKRLPTASTCFNV